VGDLVRGGLDVLLVRGAFDGAKLAPVVQALGGESYGLHVSRENHPGASAEPMRVFGDPLWTSYAEPHGPPRERYFANAQTWRTVARKLMPPDMDYEAFLAQTLGAVARGRRVEVARAPDGRAYGTSTFRFCPPGNGTPFHIDNYFDEVPGYSHLQSLMDLTFPISFFGMMSAPEKGGDLEVFELRFNDPRAARDAHIGKDPSGLRSQVFSMDTGDLVVFASGRFWHRISRVEGPSPRWTIGGMLGVSRDDHTVFYWA
jgi:hypothetical protein